MRPRPAAIIYALFCTSRHISTGPSSSLAAVAGGAVLLTGSGGAEAAQLVAAIAIATGALFLLVAILRLGWIARFLSQGGRDRVPGRCRDRRRHRRAAQAHRARPRMARTRGRSSHRGSGAWATSHWATLLVGLVALAVILGLRFTLPEGPGRARARGRRPGRVGRCSTWARTAWRSSGRCRAACRSRRSRRSTWCRRTSRDRHRGASRCCSSGSRRRPAMPGRSRRAIGIAST